MKKIAVITVSRADYGIFYPILKEINKDKNLKLQLIVSGSHLSYNFGYTIKDIEKDGFEINDKVEMLLSSDEPSSISKSIGLGIIGFAKSYELLKPDILMLLGDRFETLAAAVASIPFNIPIAHVHGGEETEGAIDNVIRHSISKMSHIHFVTTKEYAKRLINMGEEKRRIYIIGAPSLDNLKNLKLFQVKDLEKKLDFSLNPPPLLVTFHPVTMEIENTEYYINELLKALLELKFPVIFTMPNADTKNSIIRNKILEFSKSYKNCKVFENLGTKLYFCLMKYALAMVGNSSSGIIEAPSFKLPVVNIGTRQKGRIKAKNVIDTGYSSNEIIEAIKKATSKDFRKRLGNLKNPYGDGNALKKLVKIIERIKIDKEFLKKVY